MEPRGECKASLTKAQCKSRDCNWNPDVQSTIAGRLGGISSFGVCEKRKERRLQRQFISCLMSFGAFAFTGALRGEYRRVMVAVGLLGALMLRTMYISVLFEEPVAVAGLVGLLFGLLVVGVTMGLPHLFDSPLGSEATELFAELEGLLNPQADQKAS